MKIFISGYVFTDKKKYVFVCEDFSFRFIESEPKDSLVLGKNVIVPDKSGFTTNNYYIAIFYRKGTN